MVYGCYDGCALTKIACGVVHGTIKGNGSQNIRQAGNASQLNPPGSLVRVALVLDILPEGHNLCIIHNLQTKCG